MLTRHLGIETKGPWAAKLILVRVGHGRHDKAVACEPRPVVKVEPTRRTVAMGYDHEWKSPSVGNITVSRVNAWPERGNQCQQSGREENGVEGINCTRGGACDEVFIDRVPDDNPNQRSAPVRGRNAKRY